MPPTASDRNFRALGDRIDVHRVGRSPSAGTEYALIGNRRDPGTGLDAPATAVSVSGTNESAGELLSEAANEDGTMVTRGFSGKARPTDASGRLPPGQFITQDFPVLSAGPTPRVTAADWQLTLRIGPRPVRRWSWEQFNRLPMSTATRDIHCVTRWSKFDTTWTGILIDDLLAEAGIEPPTPYVLAHSVDGYSTNVPTQDLVGGRAMVAVAYEGRPIPSEHGGPARLLVPHLYFWKSAKWLNGLQFTERDEAGFWELRGYHIYGDPWKEQRYSGD